MQQRIIVWLYGLETEFSVYIFYILYVNQEKRWQEYTEELYKKDHHDPDNYNGVITHVEPDILEFEVIGSTSTNKASGGDGILVELFQILKMMLWKCCTQYASKFGKSAVSTGLEKVHFHSSP